MKRFPSILAVLLLPVLCLALSGASTGVYYKYQSESAVCSAAKDTLAGVDSTTLLTDFVPSQKGELVLCYNTLSGTGSDSVVAVVRVQAKNSAGTTLGYVYSDTIESSLAGQISIPIGAAAIGYKFTLKLMSLTGTGTQLIVNAMEVWRRQAVSTQLIIGR